MLQVKCSSTFLTIKDDEDEEEKADDENKEEEPRTSMTSRQTRLTITKSTPRH
ncbi:hypothetical protein ACEQPO_17190 [Bacillus sp. SL00103]